jgi:hypothetical protein
MRSASTTTADSSSTGDASRTTRSTRNCTRLNPGRTRSTTSSTSTDVRDLPRGPPGRGDPPRIARWRSGARQAASRVPGGRPRATSGAARMRSRWPDPPRRRSPLLRQPQGACGEGASTSRSVRLVAATRYRGAPPAGRGRGTGSCDARSRRPSCLAEHRAKDHRGSSAGTGDALVSIADASLG